MPPRTTTTKMVPIIRFIRHSTGSCARPRQKSSSSTHHGAPSAALEWRVEELAEERGNGHHRGGGTTDRRGVRDNHPPTLPPEIECDACGGKKKRRGWGRVHGEIASHPPASAAPSGTTAGMISRIGPQGRAGYQKEGMRCVQLASTT